MAGKGNPKGTPGIGPKRTTQQLESDRRDVAALYLRGWSQARILSDLNSRPGRRYTISQGTLSNDIAAIRQEWLDSTLIDFDQRMAHEVAKIDELERVYWERFTDSLKPTTTTNSTQQTGTGGNGPVDVTTVGVREVSTAGDKRWLEGVQWCIETRCRLFNIPRSDAGAGVTVDSLIKAYGNLDLDKV